MRVIARKKLRTFWEQSGYKDAEQPLRAWFAEAKRSGWRNPVDIKMLYGNASILKNNRVVFNICGNKYRLVVMINYKAQVIFIRFIGTHKEYDEINAEEI